MAEGRNTVCTRPCLLYRVLIVVFVSSMACSSASCPRVHIYNCARFDRIRKKANTCKFTFVVPAFADGTCPNEDTLSLSYLEVAKLQEKYDDMERKMDDLMSEVKGSSESQQPTDSETVVPAVLMQQDGGNVLEGRDSAIDVNVDPAPQSTNTGTGESYTVTITAHLATNTDLEPEIDTHQRYPRMSRKSRSVCKHDFKVENVKISQIVDPNTSEPRSTVSKTSDFDSSTENISHMYSAEVARLREENKSLQNVVDRLEARLQKLETEFKDVCNT